MRQWRKFGAGLILVVPAITMGARIELLLFFKM
jgi:hypothetical protein